MSLEGMAHAAGSVSFRLRQQEVLSQNLANASTDAFKAVRIAASQGVDESRQVPVERIDLSQGSFRQTGRPLDVGLDGPGFLVVLTDLGERWIRGGSLQLDGDGRLTDLHGNPVLSTDGPIYLHGADVEIRSDGTIHVGGTFVGRLRIETAEDESELMKDGNGRFVTNEPMRAISEDETRVRQGVIEESNVDPILSMVDLITIQRAYAANIEALRAMDSVLGVISSDVGKA